MFYKANEHSTILKNWFITHFIARSCRRIHFCNTGTRHAIKESCYSMDYIDYAFKERVDRAMIDVKQV